MSPPEPPRVLCVTGPETASVRAAFEDAGWTADDGDGEAVLDPEVLDLLVIGPDAEPATHASLLAEVKARREEDLFVPVLVLCRASEPRARVGALRAGADESMDAGAPAEELVARGEALVRIKRIQDRMARSRRALRRAAVVDAATGLAQRAHLLERLEDALAQARRDHDPLALVVASLDGFEARREAEDHGWERRILAEVGAALAAGVRASDTAGRLDRATFGLLLPKTHLSGALAAARRVWHALDGLRAAGGSGLTSSLGVALFPSRKVGGPEDLLDLAEDARSRAQAQGPDRICLYQATHYFYRPDEPDSGPAAAPDTSGPDAS